jgi:3-Deoxy-D-manno-octulosonic-acid transferase (kdotransferase)
MRSVERTPHIWAHGETIEAFTRAWPLLTALCKRYPRYRLLVTARSADTRRRLGAAFPDATVEPPPPAVDWQVRQAVSRLRPHALLLLEHPHDLGRAVFDRARWWRFPVVLLGSGDVALSRAGADVLAAIDHFIVHDVRAADALRARDFAPDRVTVTSDVARSRFRIEGDVDSGASRTLAALLSVLGRDWAALGTPRPRGPAGWGARLAESWPGRLALGFRAHRIDSLAALRRRLGACDTILCLGNGPSSEATEIRDVRYDVLFRVNCRWKDRGGPDRPQVVFTGDSSCLRAVPDAILAFRTVDEERRLLVRHLLGVPRRLLSYMTVERLPVSLVERRWPARPTNGAAMVSTAAALGPRRLVIAGIDLFQHPAGAYPGDPVTPNDYLLMHDRETELAIIELALRRFPGEVVLLSEPLRCALETRRAASTTEAWALS